MFYKAVNIQDKQKIFVVRKAGKNVHRITRKIMLSENLKTIRVIIPWCPTSHKTIVKEEKENLGASRAIKS